MHPTQRLTRKKERETDRERERTDGERKITTSLPFLCQSYSHSFPNTFWLSLPMQSKQRRGKFLWAKKERKKERKKEEEKKVNYGVDVNGLGKMDVFLHGQLYRERTQLEIMTTCVCPDKK